jgi:imidazolonepropionase
MLPEEVHTARYPERRRRRGAGRPTGSIEPGKQADLLLWEAPNLDFIFYRFGNKLVHTVIKKGKLAAGAQRRLNRR